MTDTIEATMSIYLDRTDPQVYDELAPFALPALDADARHQIADALTAIIVQAETIRRSSPRSQPGGPDARSSSEHIIDCAKRIWHLITDRPDSGSSARYATAATGARRVGATKR